LKRKGFSLIEVLVAMSITAVLVVSVYFSFSNILLGRSRLRKIMNRERQIYFTLDMIRNDIKNSYLSMNKGVPEETHKTIFKSDPDSPVSHLTMTTLNHVRMLADAKQCDQTEIEYFGDRVDDENVLFRRESTWVDDFPERGGNVYPVFKGFKEIKFEYWNPQNKEWVEDWNSESAANINSLPTKVKITLIAKEGELGEPDKMVETVIKLKMTRPISF
jgi:type II secretion system protein J